MEKRHAEVRTQREKSLCGKAKIFWTGEFGEKKTSAGYRYQQRYSCTARYGTTELPHSTPPALHQPSAAHSTHVSPWAMALTGLGTSVTWSLSTYVECRASDESLSVGKSGPVRISRTEHIPQNQA
jgi:hypothetical protein